jgi:hypothetical protein
MGGLILCRSLEEQPFHYAFTSVLDDGLNLSR